MTIPTFTLRGSALDLLDVTDPQGLDSITLTPNTRGQVISIGSDLHRPEPVTVTLDENGAINGTAGIELLANDPALGLADPLQWQVQVNTSAGFIRRPTAFWFTAPDDGEIAYLGDISSAPLLSPTGIARGPRGVDGVVPVGDSIQFQFRGDPVGDPIPLWISGIDCGEFGTSRDNGTIDGGSL
jgi:hypothetical protein